jgi:biopolymer transport protein ExbD
MRIRDNTTEDEQPLNMASMMDIVFNLLIFFLVATTMAQEEREINVKLPSTAKFTTMSAPPQQVIVNIMQDGSKVVQNKKYDEPMLQALLTDWAKSRPDGNVLIRADEQSFHKHFAAVARVCKQAGVTDLRIGYLFDAPK